MTNLVQWGMGKTPLPNFKNDKELVIHALEEAQKRIDIMQPSIASSGGIALFSGTKEGIFLSENGLEILQIAGCETFRDHELWVKIYNAVIKSNNDMVTKLQELRYLACNEFDTFNIHL